MSDRFDQDMKKALKESTARSLQGWEFTPAMRQAVLKRIAAAEDPFPAPVRRPTQRRALANPIIWVAAAAAVVALSVNLRDRVDLTGTTSRQAAPQAAESAGNVGSAPPEARKMAEAIPEASSATPGRDENDAGVSTFVAPPQAESDEAATAGAPEESLGQPPASVLFDVSDSQVATALTAPSAALLSQTAPPRTILQVPDAAAVRGQSARPNAADVGIMTMAAPVEYVTMASLKDDTVLLTTAAVKVVDRAGALVWEQPLPAGPGLLAVSPTGQISVTSGEELLFYSAEGKPEGSRPLPGAVSAAAYAPDGRFAVVAGGSLVVTQGEEAVFQVPDLSGATIAFAPDGTLALFAHEGTAPYLELFGRSGTRLARVAVHGGGTGLTFAGDGQYVLAGGEAFHRSGQSVWQVGFATRGMLSLGTGGPVVAYDEKQVSLLRPADGTAVWTAEYTSGAISSVAVSASGDQVAILGSTEDGAVVWVVDSKGGQRYAERLDAMPADLTVEGDSLFLLMPDGLETRQISRVSRQPRGIAVR